MGTLLNWLNNFVRGLGQYIADGFMWSLGKLLDLALLLTGWLPDHVPIDWPDASSVGVFWRGLGLVGRFVNLPLLFGTIGLILTIELGILLYAAYRALLGFVPMFK